MKLQSPKYAGTVIHDTANSANAGVLRDTDNSINVGQANVVNLDNSGGMSLQPANFTTTGTLGFTSTLITVDATGGAFALTLPAVAGAVGVVYFIAKKDAAHTVTLTGNGSETIQTTASTANTYAMSTQGQIVIIWSDGTQWYAKI